MRTVVVLFCMRTPWRHDAFDCAKEVTKKGLDRKLLETYEICEKWHACFFFSTGHSFSAPFLLPSHKFDMKPP